MTDGTPRPVHGNLATAESASMEIKAARCARQQLRAVLATLRSDLAASKEIKGRSLSARNEA